MDVGEEVVVGEVVVGDRIIRDEAASSRTERSPKILSPFYRTGLKRCGLGGLLSRHAVHAASRDEEGSSSAEIGTVWREEEDLLMCPSGEERPLLYRHSRGMRTGCAGR